MRSDPLTFRQVAEALKLVMAIEVDALECVVQEAHESPPGLRSDPPEPFDVSRQALRMFWHFRCNLEAVVVKVNPKEQAAAVADPEH